MQERIALLLIALWGAAPGYGQEAKLHADRGFGLEQFGQVLALDGDRAIIGAPDDAENGVARVGSAYLFEWDGTAWNEVTKLNAGDAGRDAPPPTPPYSHTPIHIQINRISLTRCLTQTT